ncbi:MAG: hypothetical protein RJA99_568 [Pseudomonadota bacterium]|jgi:hypothetical protein
MSSAIRPTAPPLTVERRERAAATAFALVLAAVVALLLALTGATVPDHDAIQALGAARALLAGEGFASPIVYYEPQIGLGPPVPVRQTVFPPGAAWVIAVLVAAGVPPPQAPALAALVMLAASAELLRRLLRAGGCPPAASAAVAIVWLAHPRVLELTRAGASEPAFVAALLAVALAVSHAAGARRPAATLAIAGAFGALAVTVRYVGVLPVAAMAAATWVAFRHAGPRRASAAALTVGLPAAIVLAAMAMRNHALTGRLSGGQFDRPAPPGAAAALEALAEAVRLALALPALPGVGEVLLGLGVLALGAGLLGGLLGAARGPGPGPDARRAAAALLACAAAAGAQAAFFAWNAATVATWFASWRYLLPLGPLLAAVVAILVSARPAAARARPLGVAALVAVAGLAAVSGLRETRIVSPLSVARAQVDAALETRCGDRTVRERLAALPPDEPVLSTEEHLVYLLTGRPVLGTTSRLYTSRTWTPAAVGELMRRFDAREVLVVPPALARRAPAFVGQPFHEALAAGRVPDGFEAVCDSPAVRVLRRTSDGG